MQAVQNQTNLSFSYLHNNICPDFIQESLFKFMPILKNLNTRNMVPVVDFEEFNAMNNDDQKFDLELKYILVHLFEILPRLSESSASTAMLRIPAFMNEDISYLPFPRSNYMAVDDIKKMVSHDSGIQDD